MILDSDPILPSEDMTLWAGFRRLSIVRRIAGPSGVLIGTTIAQNLLRLLSAMILTRLLSPSAYGSVSIIMSVFFIIAMITDTGCQAFIVRHARGLEPRFLDAVWTIHVLRGAVVTVVGVGIALPLAHVLNKPQLAPLLTVASLSLLIDGAISLSVMTALREKMVRRLSLLDLAISFVQVVVAVIFALLLRNVWAMVIGIITASLVRTIGSYLLFPNALRRFRIDRDIATELWSFSRLIVASSILTLIISQIDRLILARAFSLEEFGVYAVAGTLAGTPISLVYVYTSRIIYPTVAEAWRKAPERLRDQYYATRGLVFYGYLFAAGGLIGSASLVVTILYDPRYAGAAFYLHLLAITTAMLMLTKTMNEVMVASGRVRMTLDVNIVRVIWLVVAAVVGYLAIGTTGIVIALALIEVPAYLYGVYRLSSLGLYSVRHELAAFAMIGVGVATGLLAATIVPMLIPLS